MAPRTETVESGGQQVAPLSQDLVNLFQGLINNSGQQGPGQNFSRANPVGKTNTIQTGIQSILGGGPIDVTGQQEAIQSVIQKQTNRDVADLRERFTAQSGGGVGTPAAVAEALFRSESAPRIALATGQLDLQRNQQTLQSLQPIIQLISLLSQFGSQGIAPARTDVVVKDNPFASGAEAIAGILQGIGAITPG